MDIYQRMLPYFSDRYDFRFCRLDEADKLAEFIDNYWKKGHALVKSRVLLDWQYRDEENARYNFAVAYHKETGEFHAIAGFVPSSQFDRNIENPLVWGALWKARDDVDDVGIGIMVDQYFYRNVPHLLVMGIGLSQQSVANQKSQHRRVGYLDQFYMLNESFTQYELCVPAGKDTIHQYPQCDREIIKLDENDLLNGGGSCYGKRPVYKSRMYYVNRYLRHPLYTYEAYGIKNKNDIEAVLFTRICEYNGSKAIRIVDFIGDGSELSGCEAAFQRFLKDRNAEYIDFIEFGIPKASLAAGGFVDRHESGAVIPNYYEPFVKANCEIIFQYPDENLDQLGIICKGDSDQDRPNIILD